MRALPPTPVFARELATAVAAVAHAARITQRVYASRVGGITKADRSPVTIADFGSQAVVNLHLARDFPADGVVAEEDTKELTTQRADVAALVNSVLDKTLTEAEILALIDRGNHAGGPGGRFWALDPIDGTKGFLRGEQYAICLALVVDGRVRVGVLGCPNLAPGGCVLVAVEGHGAFQSSLEDESAPFTKVAVSSASSLPAARFCESYEAAHSSHSQTAEIASRLGITKPPLRLDSQCKYACVARGEAEIYLRLPVRADYEEKIWDHAAGALIVAEAGGVVGDMHGRALDFSAGRTLRNNAGILVANSCALFDPLLSTIQHVVAGETGNKL